MRNVDTGSLLLVDNAVGIGRPTQGHTLPTQFDDQVLQQSLDVSDLVARGTAADLDAGLEGLFAIVMHTRHPVGASSAKFTGVNPWLGDDGFIHGPMPSKAQLTKLDIWLLYVGLFQVLGTTIVSAVLKISGGNSALPRIVHDSDNSGLDHTPDSASLVAWSNVILDTPGTLNPVLTSTSESTQRLGVRLPRGMQVDFSTVADATAAEHSFTAVLMCAAVPRGMRCNDAV